MNKETIKELARIIADPSLKGPQFEGSDLEGGNLVEADFLKANFKNANLKGANLERANIMFADMRGTKTDGANFKDAILSGSLRNEDDLPIEGWVLRDGQLRMK